MNTHQSSGLLVYARGMSFTSLTPLAGVLQAAETLCDLSKRRQYDTERVVPPRRPTTSTAGGHAE